MAESFNFSVGFMGASSGGRIGPARRVPTLDEVVAAIRSLPVTDDQRVILEREARRVPSGSLGHFLKNYRSHLKSS
jgi:hypothetical protein